MKGKIETIKGKKIEKDGSVYYLVKYHGYSDKRNTWEPFTKLCEMNPTVYKLLENFEEELNKKFKQDSNKILGGLTTITKMDETDIQLRTDKMNNFLHQNIDINKNKPFNNEMKGNFDINTSVNEMDIVENDYKKFNYQPKEIVDIIFDPIKKKPVLKVRWNELNTNGMETESEEDYNEIKTKYPLLLISYFEKNAKIIHQKSFEENEKVNICDMNLKDILDPLIDSKENEICFNFGKLGNWVNESHLQKNN